MRNKYFNQFGSDSGPMDASLLTGTGWKTEDRRPRTIFRRSAMADGWSAHEYNTQDLGWMLIVDTYQWNANLTNWLTWFGLFLIHTLTFASEETSSLIIYCVLVSLCHWRNDHGHLLRTAHKLSATKSEPSHWSTGHSAHLWLADQRQINL